MLSSPLKLQNVRINGFAATSAYAGDPAKVLVRAALISDQPAFHMYMRGITDLIVSGVREATGQFLSMHQTSGFVLITHEDRTADLHLNDLQHELEIMPKRDIAKGDPVYCSGIADIRRMRIPALNLLPRDGIIICFKVGWKFALFFDLAPNRDIDISGMEKSLGRLYRYLFFEDVFLALGDPELIERLTRSGWFPFIETLGGEFEKLLNAYRLNFNITGEEEALLKAFDPARVDGIAARWSKRPCLKDRKAILEPALEAFKRSDPVSCLKIILTEMEGVIQDAHIAELGKGAPIQQLLRYAIDRGAQKAQDDSSLLFPEYFLQYLLNHTYARFDPQAPQADIMSRHSVGHGRADARAYTLQRALQAILTLDQIAFYL